MLRTYFLNHDLEQVHGKKFEAMLFDIAFNKDGWTFSSNHQDLYEGTDFIYRGQRFDLATGSGDRKIKDLWKEQYFPYKLSDDCQIEIGIRLRNGIQEFKEPVIVLEFQEFYSENLAFMALETLVKEMPKVRFEAARLLDEYRISLKKSRQKI